MLTKQTSAVETESGRASAPERLIDQSSGRARRVFPRRSNCSRSAATRRSSGRSTLPTQRPSTGFVGKGQRQASSSPSMPSIGSDSRLYLADAGYRVQYADYYGGNQVEKSLEHFIALELLQVSGGDVFIDIASEHSPFAEIVARLKGATTFSQDIMYPDGVIGNRIGGSACALPVPDGFASKACLTCWLQHFEGDGDTRLFLEFGARPAPGRRRLHRSLLREHRGGHADRSGRQRWRQRFLRIRCANSLCRGLGEPPRPFLQPGVVRQTNRGTVARQVPIRLPLPDGRCGNRSDGLCAVCFRRHAAALQLSCSRRFNDSAASVLCAPSEDGIERNASSHLSRAHLLDQGAQKRPRYRGPPGTSRTAGTRRPASEESLGTGRPCASRERRLIRSTSLSDSVTECRRVRPKPEPLDPRDPGSISPAIAANFNMVAHVLL